MENNPYKKIPVFSGEAALLFAEGVHRQLIPGIPSQLSGSLPVLLACAEGADDPKVNVIQALEHYDNRYS